MNEDGKNQKKYIIVSKIYPNDKIIETIYNPIAQQTSFAIMEKGGVKLMDKINSGKTTLFPINSTNPLLLNNLVKFPSKPIEYTNEEKLLNEVQIFINKYVDLSNDFEKIATYYVLLSWVYDRFNEIPYLRKIGELGSGKTRFLKVLGSICYKPIFASGSTSTAALFHIIDKFQGTLIIDEADFTYSDEKSAVAKILNNGNASGFPVLRVAQSPSGKFTPVSYNVFCPKIIASRGNFSDVALESRFITETFRPVKIRDDIPTTLPDTFENEALELRNKLLYYRFKNLFKIKKVDIPQSYKLEGRIKQIFSPLLSVINDPSDKKIILDIAKSYNKELVNERKQNIEAQVLTIIKKLSDEEKILSIKNITHDFYLEYANYYSRKITAKWIGYIIRKKLNLYTIKTDGNFVIDPTCHHLLPQLYHRYDI